MTNCSQDLQLSKITEEILNRKFECIDLFEDCPKCRQKKMFITSKVCTYAGSMGRPLNEWTDKKCGACGSTFRCY
jgi:hypothetical protein